MLHAMLYLQQVALLRSSSDAVCMLYLLHAMLYLLHAMLYLQQVAFRAVCEPGLQHV
jgi:hypothetical protein